MDLFDWLTIETPNPYIRMVIRNAPEEMKKTTIKKNEVNPVWNESFTFLLDDRQINNMEISLMEANDDFIGTEALCINYLPLNEVVNRTIIFNEVSEVDIEMRRYFDQKPDLRYSFDLPDKEKEFLTKRKEKVMEGLKQLLGERGPTNIFEVPTVAVIGSGGGFRAMVGFSGVFKALHDSGILQCATYVGGLSGSSWYISTLYSHEDFPKLKAPCCIQEELKHNIDSEPVWLLMNVPRYIYCIMKKRLLGQPVNLIDIWGHLIGDKVLKGRLDCTLSELQQKIKDGDVPMPLLTCANVKEHDSSYESFQEMIEFSPYEIGLPKYGVFVPTELFGSKFFMGTSFKRFEEQPLHFLLGLWGSAFAIIYKTWSYGSMISQANISSRNESVAFGISTLLNTTAGRKMICISMIQLFVNFFNVLILKGQFPYMDIKLFEMFGILATSTLLSSRAGRVGVIHNFMRGLYLPQQSLNENDPQQYPINFQQLHIADAGLVCNSPYPPVLRSARKVDVILSFDFSDRSTDDVTSDHYLEELWKAFGWAGFNGIPFPKIEMHKYDQGDIKELFIFTRPDCPVVLHFCLINKEFKHSSKPGEGRVTKKSKDFADFDVFRDPKKPYSTMTFKYSHYAFDRLAKLTEFNTLLKVDEVKKQFEEIIEQKRRLIFFDVCMLLPLLVCKRLLVKPNFVCLWHFKLVPFKTKLSYINWARSHALSLMTTGVN